MKSRNMSSDSKAVLYSEGKLLSPSMDHAKIWLLNGLRVYSNYPFPFPSVSAACGMDMIIRYDGLVSRCAPDLSITNNPVWRQDADEWQLQYHNRDTGDVLLFRFAPDGSLFSIQHSFPEWRDLPLIILNPALAAALYLRNIPLIHGSAVSIHGASVILAGKSGVGKSTLTAALVAEGMPFLTDDLTALYLTEDSLAVEPGYPLLKISKETAGILGKSWKDLMPVATWSEERWIQADGVTAFFCNVRMPVCGIYILEGRRGDISMPEIIEMSSAEACFALMGYLYGDRWLNIPGSGAIRLCAAIAGMAPVRRVWLPDGLNTLQKTARVLIDDASSKKTMED